MLQKTSHWGKRELDDDKCVNEKIEGREDNLSDRRRMMFSAAGGPSLGDRE
jgi:hypothetical protein